MNMLCNTTSCGHFKHSCPWSLAPVKLPFLQGKILAMHSSVAVGLTSNQELTTVEFVKLNDQIEGLTYLLTLGVRVLTVTEFVLRRSLEQDQVTLPGLHPENKHKRTDKPTAERLLKAFSGVSLTIIKHAAGEDIMRRLTPLSAVQEAIVQRLGLGTNLYRQLEIQNMKN